MTPQEVIAQLKAQQEATAAMLAQMEAAAAPPPPPPPGPNPREILAEIRARGETPTPEQWEAAIAYAEKEADEKNAPAHPQVDKAATPEFKEDASYYYLRVPKLHPYPASTGNGMICGTFNKVTLGDLKVNGCIMQSTKKKGPRRW